MKSLGFSRSSAELSGFATAMALGITVVLPGHMGDAAGGVFDAIVSSIEGIFS